MSSAQTCDGTPSGSDVVQVLRSDSAGIVTLTLNQPHTFNVLSSAMLTALQQHLDAIAVDKSARVVVLASTGKAFCAGHNLKEMRANPEQEFQQALFDQCSRMMMTINRLPQPVIARIQGLATAAGCQLVAACDLAVAAESAIFATSGIRVGLFCSTPAVAVSRNLSRKQAMELLLTGEFIDAKTAQQQGLINRAVPEHELDVAIAELAGHIVAKSPVAVETGKRMFYKQLELGMEDAYAYASEIMACNMMAADAEKESMPLSKNAHRSGVDANDQNKSPKDGGSK